jgi:hypothetical protein
MPTIVPSKAPNLPRPPVQPDQRHSETLNNSLRLYFTQLDNATSQLSDAANSGSVQQWLDGGCY